MTGLTPPVENTDYDANTAQDGSGTDISSELTVTHPYTSDYHGRGTLIRVTFGATAGYLGGRWDNWSGGEAGEPAGEADQRVSLLEVERKVLRLSRGCKRQYPAGPRTAVSCASQHEE